MERHRAHERHDDEHEPQRLRDRWQDVLEKHAAQRLLRAPPFL